MIVITKEQLDAAWIDAILKFGHIHDPDFFIVKTSAANFRDAMWEKLNKDKEEGR